MPAQKIQADKFLHLLAFAYLGYLAARSLGWWAVFLVIGFAAVNEVQQFFAAGREVSWIDLAANQVGALLGFALGYLRRRRALQAA